MRLRMHGLQILEVYGEINEDRILCGSSVALAAEAMASLTCRPPTTTEPARHRKVNFEYRDLLLDLTGDEYMGARGPSPWRQRSSSRRGSEFVHFGSLSVTHLR